jgi:hypothetical protein
MADSAIIGAMTLAKRFKDGTFRFQIDVSGEHEELIGSLFMGVDMPVAIARLTLEAAQQTAQQQAQALYGEEAKALRLSAFFRTPDVWRAIGSDEEFLAWLRRQLCAAPDQSGCGGDVVAAHVRRVSEGAGVGIKPPYCAIALCHAHHCDAHQFGDSRLGTREWWGRQRIEHVQQWAWESLKQQLGYAHWNQVNPRVLRDWAEQHGIELLLPNLYRSAA